MITQQELTDKCIPEIIKKMVELAEGFEIFFDEETDGFVDPFDNEYYIEDGLNKVESFPLLIHRAVEGWNRKKRDEIFKEIVIYKDKVCLDNYKLEIKQGYEDYYKYTLIDKRFKNYQPESLTHAECACLHCLLEVLR